MKLAKLNVKTVSGAYPIIIGSNLTSHLSKILKDNSVSFDKCLLVIDKNVPRKMINKLSKSIKIKNIYNYSFKSTEKNKSQKSVTKKLDILLTKNF